MRGEHEENVQASLSTWGLPLAGRHQRLPLLPFFQAPSDISVCSDAADDCNCPVSDPSGKFVGLLNSDVDSFLEFEAMDDLDFDAPKQQMMEQLLNQSYGADSVVPVGSERVDLEKHAGESCFEIDFSQSKLSQSVSSSEAGVVPDGNSSSISEVSNLPFLMSTNSDGSSAISGAFQPSQLTGIDREARVMRYREKRKNRKFEKTIRYASRKAYAEKRPRIKGRFAKRAGAGSDAERPHAAGHGGFTVDYGVVPLFWR